MIQSPGFPVSDRTRTLHLSQTDLVRFVVIGAITLSIAGVTFLSAAAGYGAIVPQLFYFPILYTTYFYPGRGVYVASCSAAAYLVIAGPFAMPNPLLVAGICFQALLFIGIAAGSGYILKTRILRPYAEPEEDAGAIHTMIRTGECDHVEFKLRSLWSMDLTKEDIQASQSAEVRKYRNNASKFIIARSIAGFLNTDGGDLVIGIREDRMLSTTEIVGIEDEYSLLQEMDRNPDGYRRMLIDSVVRKYLPEIFDSASRFIRISFPVIGGRTLCHVHVRPTERPVFVDTGSEELFFIRVDASTRALAGKAMTRYILNRFSSS
ncbi:helix-turn-helix domain-containing protein [Methanoregula sp.]|uniref:AlbA family DNA-binding domain-containing protein n=1 Tax=Methanoregula sp. TaxID=2052170 RepID=UPI003C716D9A